MSTEMTQINNHIDCFGNKFKFSAPMVKYLLSQKPGRTVTRINCCECIHPGMTCVGYTKFKFFQILAKVLKIVLLFQGIPMIIFKWKKLKNDTRNAIVSLLVDYIRACGWIQVMFCTPTISLCKVTIPFNSHDWKVMMLIYCYSALGIFVDRLNQRRNLGFFLAPKVIEVLYQLLVRRGLADNYKHNKLFL